MTSSNPEFSFPFPFEFAPQAGQDAELLEQLSFMPGLREVLTVRQVHALEHATVWVLSEAQAKSTTEALSGMSTERGFYLYGAVNTTDLRQAVDRALNRLINGDWDLAVHPRCGTNLSASILLTAGLAMGINLFLPKDPLGQLLGIGVAATTAASISTDVGSLAQHYISTAIPFNLAVEEITVGLDRFGQPYHFVSVRWVA